MKTHSTPFLYRCQHLFALFLLLSLVSNQYLSAQRVININQESSGLRSAQQLLPEQLPHSFFGASKQARNFDLNPQLKSLTTESTGDILLLDLFGDKQYRALIEQVTPDYNGITAITAKVEGTDFGYCYISVSDEGALIHVELGEKNEYYIGTVNSESGYLQEYTKTALDKNRLDCQWVVPLETPEAMFSEAGQHPPTLSSLNTRAGESEEATINVMVVYTQKAEAWIKTQRDPSMEHAIAAAMQKANTASKNSHLGITFNLVYSYKTDYEEVDSSADLDHLTNPSDGQMDEVHALRRAYDADLVMFVPMVDFTGGLGWLLSSENGSPAHGFALSRVQQLSWTTTMVHEMAHNMGCGHHNDQKEQAGPGLFPYSGGWRGVINEENKCTIMTYGDKSYWDNGVSYTEIPYFSNPDILYPESNVYIGSTATANNAQTLRQTKHVVAAYKELINNTLLTDLTINNVTVEGFDPDKTKYTYETDVKTITIDGTASAGATLDGNVTNAILNNGENTFTLSATSADGTYRKAYTVIVNRTASACESSPSRPSFSGDVSASSGEDALHLNMEAGPLVLENEFTVGLMHGYSPIYIRSSENSSTCYTYGDGGSYGVYRKIQKIKVTESGSYKIVADKALILTLFDAEEPSCGSFLNSSGYYKGDGITSYSNNVTVNLEANTTYYLSAMLYSSPSGVFQIAIEGSGIGYTETDFPEGMNYTYIAVNQSDNKIAMHSPTADFRRLPEGNYTIYGVPYAYGSQADSFIGKSVAEIQSAACVILSSTSINMTVSAGVINAEAPRISQQPQKATYTKDDTATPLKVTAAVSDGGTLSYQWFSNSTDKTTNGTSLGSDNGAQTDTYTPSTSTIGTTYYYVNVTNTNQAVNGKKEATTTSNIVTITIEAVPTYGVSIGSFSGGSVRASSPSSSNGSSIPSGETVTLTIAVADGYLLETIAAYQTGNQATNVALNGSGNEDGATRTFVMPAYAVTVTATFKKTQKKQDEEAVESVKEAVEGGSYRVTETAGNTEESVRTWIVSTLNTLFGSSLNVEFRSSGSPVVGNVEIKSFSPAVAGTAESPEGQNGSFTFNVTLTLGATTLSTKTTSGTILALPYSVVPKKNIELSLVNELTIRVLNMGNVATDELTLALSGTHADAFILPSSTIASLAIGADTTIVLSMKDDLQPGTYKAILSVSAEELPAVSQEISCVVTGTALEETRAETLKAGVQNGTLYVSGLTPGKPWSVYTISGVLIHHRLAKESEEQVSLLARGVYIITSGDRRIKVVY